MFLFWRTWHIRFSHAAGVHASCPIELSPSSVVVRYGDSVSINCSASESPFEGIGWEATVGGKNPENVTHVAWTVEKLTDWTIAPICFINPSKDSTFEQCEQSPKVVVYSKSCLFGTEPEWQHTILGLMTSTFSSSIPRKHQHQLQQWPRWRGEGRGEIRLHMWHQQYSTRSKSLCEVVQRRCTRTYGHFRQKK